jgi:UPF0755 protein
LSQTNDRWNQWMEQSEEARLVRRIVAVVVSAVLVLIVAGGLFATYYVQRALKPLNADSKQQKVVTIPTGSSASEIGRILKDKGIIRNAAVFRFYCKYKNEHDFKAGVYRLSPSMSIDQIIKAIESGRTYAGAELTLTIPEGLWVEDIAARIAAKTKYSKDEILNVMKDRAYIKTHFMKDYPFLNDVILDKQIKYPLEGYLFPATYRFTKKNPSIDEIIKQMLDKTQAVLGKYQDDIANSRLGSIHKVLTMASLVEAEAKNDTDRGLIAGVFYNRLKKGMPLQSDMTALYAVGKRKAHVTFKDTGQSSPYNTYLHKNLPVGPIDNPGEASLRAVLHPTPSDYLYFYARPNGEILYAKTLKEHQANIKKYKKEWAKLKEE